MDANILIRGVTFPRYPFEILRLAARRMIVCVVSPSVLADARHYLSLLFPGHLPKLDGFLATALIEMVADPTPEEIEGHWDLVRDFKDVPVVMAAATADVDFLVSTDKERNPYASFRFFQMEEGSKHHFRGRSWRHSRKRGRHPGSA